MESNPAVTGHRWARRNASTSFCCGRHSLVESFVLKVLENAEALQRQRLRERHFDKPTLRRSWPLALFGGGSRRHVRQRLHPGTPNIPPGRCRTDAKPPPQTTILRIQLDLRMAGKWFSGDYPKFPAIMICT